jgi:ribosomal protein S12 methylthiotransferase accessory factor
MDWLIVSGCDRDLEEFRRVLHGRRARIVAELRADAVEERWAEIRSLEKPLMVARVGTRRLWLARWLRAGGTGCPECLERRLLGEWDAPARDSIRATGPLPLGRGSAELVMDLASQLLDTADGGICGVAVELEALRWSSFRSVLDSTCPVCRMSGSELHRLSPGPLTRVQKRHPAEYRAKLSTELGLATETYLDQSCGLLGRGHRRDLHHPFSARVHGSFLAGRRRRHITKWCGNQKSYDESLIVGTCEAFERYDAISQRGSSFARIASLAELTEDALDPRVGGVYEDSLYQEDGELSRFSAEQTLRWVWGYSITQDKPVLVPAQLAYYGLHFDDEPRFVYENSNGCATGSSLEEATLFALLELIERDSFLMHWLNRLSAPHIDQAGLTRASLGFLLGRLERKNFEVVLLDARVDTRVPTVMAIVARRDGGLGAFSVASASRFDPEAAAEAALSEAAGYHVGFEARVRRDEKRLRATLEDFRGVRTIADHGSIYGLPEAVPHTDFMRSSPERLDVQRAYRNWTESLPRTSSLLDDITHVLSQLRNAGLQQVVIVDLSSPESRGAGLHTVKAFVPGLLPMDFGYGRIRAASLQRLYDAPVLLGHRDRPMTAGEINRIPHPFP